MRGNEMSDAQEVILPNNEPAVLPTTAIHVTRFKEARCVSHCVSYSSCSTIERICSDHKVL